MATITSGEVRIGDRAVNELGPKERDIAMVFQNYALYPHMTVEQNTGFALKLAKLPKAEIGAKVRRAAQVLGLTQWLERKPAQLSGGQRQRVESCSSTSTSTPPVSWPRAPVRPTRRTSSPAGRASLACRPEPASGPVTRPGFSLTWARCTSLTR
jgi:ABC-type cobalamin transport system ATPase subunit